MEIKKMYCQNCKKNIGALSKWCPFCGCILTLPKNGFPKLLLLFIIVLLISGCINYNADLICEEYCNGKPIVETNTPLGYYVKCTSPNGWNLSSYSEGYFEVKCMVLE